VTDTSGASGELRRLAEALGITTAYWDTQGNLHEAGVDALIAVLASLGLPVEHPERLDDLRRSVENRSVRFLPPVVVHWFGTASVDVDLCLPASASPSVLAYEVRTEAGDTHRGEVPIESVSEVDRRSASGTEHTVRRLSVSIPEGLPIGYHGLSVFHGPHRHDATLIVAPVQVPQPGFAERTWGVLAPLYALRTPESIGPHVGHLARLGEWIDAEGGRIVATLPVLATYLDEPCDFSPYTPVSQRFWNELYLDVEATPELASSALARARLADPVRRAVVRRLADAARFDHRQQYEVVRPVLEALADTFFAAPASTRTAFDRWLAEHPSAAAYARFRAACDQTRTGWHAWGSGPGRLPEGVDTDGEDARFHQYVQWTMHRQLTGVAAELSARDQRLYLDLPVGTHGDGFDTWSAPELFAWGCGVGAPPDDFFGDGQNWGFPPVNPFAGREQGHRHLAACLRHHMSVAGVLRLDHVMGFERLYWVPDGAHARDGVYVRYPRDELFAVLGVEASRSGCRVVGEDLGTVPDEVRHALGRHGLLGMYVSQFRLPGPGEPMPLPTDHQVAGIDTHDTPTLRGWLDGLDIGIRHGMGLLDDAETEAAHHQRGQDIAQLRGALSEAGHLRDGDDVLVGLLRALGASPAPSVLVEVDDLLDETEPQNVPGTALDRPNWVHKLRLSIPELEDDPEVRATLEALQAARLSAYQSALEAVS
jgi:4-alpha-glucanotransferase